MSAQPSTIERRRILNQIHAELMRDNLTREQLAERCGIKTKNIAGYIYNLTRRGFIERLEDVSQGKYRVSVYTAAHGSEAPFPDLEARNARDPVKDLYHAKITDHFMYRLVALKEPSSCV